MPTITGYRPEVVAAVKDKIFKPLGPTSSIARRFFPMLPVADKTSDLFYMTLAADSAAESRANEAANWTAVTLGEASVDYTCTEKGKLYQIPESREKTYGSMDAVDRVGVTAACRSVARKFETDAAALVLSTANYNNGTYLTNGLVLNGLQTAAISVGKYFGNTVLIGSPTFFQSMVLSTEIAAKLTAMIGNSFNVQQFQAAVANEPNVAIGLLRAFLPFDEVLIGDSEFWGPSGKTDAAVVAKLPPANFSASPEDMEMIMREEPIYGVAPWFMADPSDRDILFKCKSFFNDNNDCNSYKAKAWYLQKVLNSGALQVVKFTSPTISTTTTSTTTTTTTTTAG